MVNPIEAGKAWFNKYFSQETDDELQTARVGSLAREFAEHPSLGLTPSKLAGIFRDAEQGNLVHQCNLFEDMEEKDAHIFSEMSKRKRALLGLEWSLVPPRDASDAETKVAEQIEEWIRDMDDFEDALLNMGDGIGKGYSNHEIEWRHEGKLLFPKLIHRPASWFTVDKDNQDKLLLRTDDGRGEELWPFGWVSHVHKAKSGYIARGGLFRVLAWPYLFKNYSVRDLAEFLEIYGLPLRIGTYPTGASDKEKNALLRAVIQIGHNAGGIIPEGMALEFKEAAKGSSDPYKAMIDWCEGGESKAILGGTLTTTAQSTGMGSNLGDVHNEVRHDLLESDARQIAGTLTRDLITPLGVLNTSIDASRLPRFVFQTQEPEDLKLYSEAIPSLVDIGMQIPIEWAHEKLQIPQAEKDDAVLKRSSGFTLTPGAATKLAALKHAGADDNVDDFIDRLQNDSAVAMENIIDRVKRLLNEVDSLEAFETRLLETYSFLDPDDMVQVIQLGMAAADLAGRYDVNEGD